VDFSFTLIDERPQIIDEWNNLTNSAKRGIWSRDTGVWSIKF